MKHRSGVRPTSAQVASALQELLPLERAVLFLSIYRHLSARDISAVLRIPLGEVHESMRAALQRLRITFEKEGLLR